MNGYNNEKKFVEKINNKFYKELDFNMQLFIETLLPSVKRCDIIKAYLSKEKIKCDFYIEINLKIYKISLKTGNKNSVHLESLTDFIRFLQEKIKLNNQLINFYLYYHFGDYTLDGSGKERISSYDCKNIYKKELIELNKILNKDENIKLAIKRFLFGSYNIDYLICGTYDDFIWISKDNIKKLLLEKQNLNKLSPSFSSLIIQPLSRCLNNNKKQEKFRYFVQIKWYNLYDDIIEYYNNELQ